MGRTPRPAADASSRNYAITPFAGAILPKGSFCYADDLKKFAEKIGIPSARCLRKDELEQAVRHFLRTGPAKSFAKRALTKFGPRDVDLGLRLDLPVAHYTSNRQTKDFVEQEAAKRPHLLRCNCNR